MTLIKRFFADMWLGVQEWILGYWRHKNYLFKKKEAIRLCVENSKKYYVVRSSMVNYMIFSSDDVKMNKKRGLFKRDLNFMEMGQIASFVVWPDHKGSYMMLKDDKGLSEVITKK